MEKVESGGKGSEDKGSGGKDGEKEQKGDGRGKAEDKGREGEWKGKGDGHPSHHEILYPPLIGNVYSIVSFVENVSLL